MNISTNEMEPLATAVELSEAMRHVVLDDGASYLCRWNGSRVCTTHRPRSEQTGGLSAEARVFIGLISTKTFLLQGCCAAD